MSHKIHTNYIKKLNVTRFTMNYGPSMALTKVIERAGNLLSGEKVFELNQVLHKLREISKYGEIND